LLLRKPGKPRLHFTNSMATHSLSRWYGPTLNAAQAEDMSQCVRRNTIILQQQTFEPGPQSDLTDSIHMLTKIGKGCMEKRASSLVLFLDGQSSAFSQCKI